ncbi:hypothetical protein TIFTF001_024323 [Ficus carica]|uniref:Uncharacterized protein n=1 Tax=Ficus carica TaxID=3494 RepID=A0AA88DKC6_FICCA|nr:hypothetical protein TIFTF001_024323 [Ficus carica]
MGFALVVKERGSNDELQEARKETVKCKKALITPAIDLPSHERYLSSFSCGIGVRIED